MPQGGLPMEDRYDEVLSGYDFLVKGMGRVRGAILLDTDKGYKLMQETHASAGRLVWENRVSMHLRANGFEKIDAFNLNNEGNISTPGPRGTRYTVRDWYIGNECCLKEKNDIYLLKGNSKDIECGSKKVFSFSNKWQHIDMAVDFKAKKAQIYLDGKIVVKDEKLNSDFGVLDFCRLYISGDATSIDIDNYQIYEAKVLGADAILLIAAILSEEKIKEFYDLAKSLEIDCLVEVHNEKELKKVVACGCDIIGINNRNLKTFDVDLNTTSKLAPLIPYEAVLVSESGMKDENDMKNVKEQGADAVLIGETFMRSDNIKETMKQLRSCL